MRHVFTANSTLKPCIKSTRIKISRNHSKNLYYTDLQENVSNLHECIFHDSDILANIAENGCMRKKTDKRYFKSTIIHGFFSFALCCDDIFSTSKLSLTLKDKGDYLQGKMFTR